MIDEEQPEGEILNPGLLRKVSSWTHHPCTAAQGGHLTWVNLSPFETIWIHLNLSDSISICLNPSLSIGSIQIWIWINLNPYKSIQIHLNSSESIWTHLNPYKSFWSHQIQYQPNKAARRDDFPAPTGPTIPTSWPWFTVKLTCHVVWANNFFDKLI